MNAPQKSECPLAGGQVAEETKERTAIVAPSEAMGKEYATLQAEFAFLGHCLGHSRRADDGRVTFTVSRWGQARNFSHLGDVRAFLAAIGGRS